MQQILRKIILLLASLFSAYTPAQESALPPLPTKGFISGRISTQQDVTSGNAAFATPPEQDLNRKPISIPIPEYAVYTADGSNKIVFIIQVEEVDGTPMIGARYPEGGEIVGTPNEFQLLGVNPTIAP